METLICKKHFFPGAGSVLFVNKARADPGRITFQYVYPYLYPFYKGHMKSLFFNFLPF